MGMSIWNTVIVYIYIMKIITIWFIYCDNIDMNEIEYNCIGDWGAVTSDILQLSEYTESDAV